MGSRAGKLSQDDEERVIWKDWQTGGPCSSAANSSKSGLGTSQLTVTFTDSFREQASETARLVTLERFGSSPFFCPNLLLKLPTFDDREIVTGCRLGKGGFSNVDEVKGFAGMNTSGSLFSPKITPFFKHVSKDPPGVGRLSRNDTVALNNEESKRFMMEHCHRRSGHARYAIKRVREDVLEDEENLVYSLCDLAIETCLLSGLDHPNVIKLRGISTANPFTSGFFVVMDRLHCTLSKKMNIWAEGEKRYSSVWGRLIRDPKATKRLRLFENRLSVAYNLSGALAYLHSKQLLHRDIKPENVGFDCVSAPAKKVIVPLSCYRRHS